MHRATLSSQGSKRYHMPSHDTLHINLVEIRHQGGTRTFQVDSLTDYIQGTAKTSNGDEVYIW